MILGLFYFQNIFPIYLFLDFDHLFVGFDE